MEESAKVLVVGEVAGEKAALADLLRSLGYHPEFAINGDAAVRLMRIAPPDVALLDLTPSPEDGLEFLERLSASARLRETPVVVISANHAQDRVIQCLELGAEDFLLKPVNGPLLRARVENCLVKKRIHDLEQSYQRLVRYQNQRLEERVSEQVRELAAAHAATIFALAQLAASRDMDTGEHLHRIREYCRALAGRLRQKPRFAGILTDEYIQTLWAASPLHDIGKVGIPDEILRKPGPLTEEQYELMKVHPLLGADTLRAVREQHPGNPLIRIGIEIAESHHEWWNGQGYPHGLRGEEIPLSARIVALADAYEALTSRRCYKPAFSHEKAREILVAQRGERLDPEIVDAFLEAEEEFLAIRQRHLK